MADQPAKRYIFETSRAESEIRFHALSEIYDPRTFQILERLGLSPGWHCWEVGAGGGATALALAKRVGPTGRVLATDIDLSWALEAIGDSDLVELRQHNIGTDELPAETFDLIHTRLLLVHVPQRQAALQAMVRALRPGGWLLIEEGDMSLQELLCPEDATPEQRLANRVGRARHDLSVQRGIDTSFGRKVPRLLREAGLEAINAEIFAPLVSAACNRLMAASLRQLREPLAVSGLATQEETAQLLHAVESGRLDLTTTPLISTSARKPL